VQRVPVPWAWRDPGCRRPAAGVGTVPGTRAAVPRCTPGPIAFYLGTEPLKLAWHTTAAHAGTVHISIDKTFFGWQAPREWKEKTQLLFKTLHAQSDIPTLSSLPFGCPYLKLIADVGF
jgi:hypothetical protein